MEIECDSSTKAQKKKIQPNIFTRWTNEYPKAMGMTSSLTILKPMNNQPENISTALRFSENEGLKIIDVGKR